MEIRLKYGIENLLFGMGTENVIQEYGKPDKMMKDDEGNIIYVYNSKRLRLTFYHEEGNRLGYMETASPDTILHGNKIIGQDFGKVKSALKLNSLEKWTSEEVDITTYHFNEEQWINLEEEFGVVVKVGIGAIINEKDEFEWKFD